MSTTESLVGWYRIAEAARLSGFAPTTLRFYEDAGVLAPPARTPAGYRMYGDRDVERLRLVARAKELGCTLEEIKGLVEAWDADECAPVKHQLRELVTSKATEVDRRITKLTELGRQLRATSASLVTSPVAGPCDDSCGCTAPALGGSSGCRCGSSTCGNPSANVSMGTTVSAVLTCSLGGGEMSERIQEWRHLLAAVTHRDEIPNGVRLTFDASTDLSEVARLVAAERDCCSFFSFTLTVDAVGTALAVTAPLEGQSMLFGVFGEAS